MKEELVCNHDAYWRMRQEGEGDFLLHYCSHKDLEDKEARKLFKKAKASLLALVEYLEKFKDTE